MEDGRVQETIYESRLFMVGLAQGLGASPDENQYIVGQVVDQIDQALRPQRVPVEGEHGFEQIFVIERHNLTIHKRVFHPGRAERATGADFVILKLKSGKVSAVQVKRNRGQDFFGFDDRELAQLGRLLNNWGSAYYLMIDETINPPLECFIMASELRNMLGQTEDGKNVSNSSVRAMCRGTKTFYESFYKCLRGSAIHPLDRLFEISQFHADQTERLVVCIALHY